MPRRSTAATQRLARKGLELSLAAPQVVQKRLTQMAQAGLQPNAHDRAEMILMGSEKVWAFYQSWMGMWMQMAQLPWAVFYALPQAASGRPMQAMKALDRISSAGVEVLHAGLEPVHARAVANAKRLSRPARKSTSTQSTAIKAKTRAPRRRSSR